MEESPVKVFTAVVLKCCYNIKTQCGEEDLCGGSRRKRNPKINVFRRSQLSGGPTKDHGNGVAAPSVHKMVD